MGDYEGIFQIKNQVNIQHLMIYWGQVCKQLEAEQCFVLNEFRISQRQQNNTDGLSNGLAHQQMYSISKLSLFWRRAQHGVSFDVSLLAISFEPVFFLNW